MRIVALRVLGTYGLELCRSDLLRVVAQRQKLRSVGVRMRTLAFPDARDLGLFGSDLLRVLAQRQKLGIVGVRMEALAFLNPRDCGSFSFDFSRVLAQGEKVRCMRVAGFSDTDQFCLFGLGADRLREPDQGQTSQPQRSDHRRCSVRKLPAFADVA
jgi:hypothetical protein